MNSQKKILYSKYFNLNLKEIKWRCCLWKQRKLTFSCWRSELKGNGFLNMQIFSWLTIRGRNIQMGEGLSEKTFIGQIQGFHGACYTKSILYAPPAVLSILPRDTVYQLSVYGLYLPLGCFLKWHPFFSSSLTIFLPLLIFASFF